MKKLISLALSSLLLISCDKDTARDIADSAPKVLGAGIDAIQRQADAVSPTLQSFKQEQLDTLYKVEYLVKDISTELSTPSLQELLTQLGNDGWEIAAVNHNQTMNTDRYTFKRRAKSFLPLILRILH